MTHIIKQNYMLFDKTACNKKAIVWLGYYIGKHTILKQLISKQLLKLI